MIGQIHNQIPAAIYYFKASATIEQWYPTGALMGYGYVNATTFRMYFRGTNDVNAIDTIQLVVTAGTNLKEIYESILNAPYFGTVATTPNNILRVFVHGGGGFRPEIQSCTIVFGECCSGGGSGTMSNWILSDGSTTQQIDNAETVTFADSTFVNNVVSATNTVTTSLSATNTPTSLTFLRGDNTWSTPPNTTYAKATDSVLGLVKLEDVAVQTTAANAITTTASRTYGLQFNASDQLVVNVPWTDSASGCADVYKTITGTTGSTVASGCSDTLTIQSPNTSIIADAATADTLKLSARKYESFVITLTDEARPITTGVKYEFRIPYNFTISWYGGVVDDSDHCKSPVKIHVNTPPSGTESAALTVNVETSTNNRVSWNSIFDVKPTIDSNEWSSVTSAARVQLPSDAAAISVNCDTVLRFTVDTVSGAPVGLKCIIMGYQAAIV